MVDAIDIQYAHLALALTSSEQIKKFAQTMFRDHEAVNEQALALFEASLRIFKSHENHAG